MTSDQVPLTRHSFDSPVKTSKLQLVSAFQSFASDVWEFNYTFDYSLHDMFSSIQAVYARRRLWESDGNHSIIPLVKL